MTNIEAADMAAKAVIERACALLKCRPDDWLGRELLKAHEKTLELIRNDSSEPPKP